MYLKYDTSFFLEKDNARCLNLLEASGHFVYPLLTYLTTQAANEAQPPNNQLQRTRKDGELVQVSNPSQRLGK
jgi:hypothetical protein